MLPRPIIGGILQLLQCAWRARCTLPGDIAQKVWRQLPVDIYLAAHYIRHVRSLKSKQSQRALYLSFVVIKDLLQRRRLAEENDTEDAIEAVLENSPYRTSDTIWDLYHVCENVQEESEYSDASDASDASDVSDASD